MHILIEHLATVRHEQNPAEFGSGDLGGINWLFLWGGTVLDRLEVVGWWPPLPAQALIQNVEGLPTNLCKVVILSLGCHGQDS